MNFTLEPYFDKNSLGRPAHVSIAAEVNPIFVTMLALWTDGPDKFAFLVVVDWWILSSRAIAPLIMTLMMGVECGGQEF